MMQLLNTKLVTVTELLLTTPLANIAPVWLAARKHVPPPNVGCSESPMGLRRGQRVIGVAANELAALNVKKAN